jgi:hypothetical protein
MNDDRKIAATIVPNRVLANLNEIDRSMTPKATATINGISINFVPLIIQPDIVSRVI